MTSKEKSIRNQEEENGSMHGFECRGDGVWQESILSDIESWGTTQEVGGITWIYDGKVKEGLSITSMQLAKENGDYKKTSSTKAIRQERAEEVQSWRETGYWRI